MYWSRRHPRTKKQTVNNKKAEKVKTMTIKTNNISTFVTRGETIARERGEYTIKFLALQETGQITMANYTKGILCFFILCFVAFV